MNAATIAALMSAQIWSIDMDTTVAQAEAMLIERGLSWVPVRAPGGEIVGALSASDLLQFHARGGDANTAPAWQVCSYRPIGVERDTPIAEVARLMVERKVHHVVVTDRGEIVGVVSSLDFAKRCLPAA
jgi:CBS domain-containing protein